MATKKCKYCKTEIDKGAKICPQCGKKQGIGCGTIILIVIAVFVLLVIISNAGKKKDEGVKKVGEVTTTDVANNTGDTADKTTAAAENKTDSSDTKSAETAAPETEAPETTTVATPEEIHVGDIIDSDGVKIVYESSGEYKGSDFNKPKDDYKFVFLKLYFQNNTESDEYVSSISFECYADGYNCDTTYGDDELSATLSSGRYTEGYLYFEVPEDAEEITVEYELNWITEKKITFVYDGDKDSGFVPEKSTDESEDAYHVGDIVETDDLRITYAASGVYTEDNQFLQPEDGYIYIYAEFDVENISDSDQSISYFSFDCYADGVECDAHYTDDGLSAEMSAGKKGKGIVVFEVPEDAQTIEVEYLDNFWTSGRVIFAVEK